MSLPKASSNTSDSPVSLTTRPIVQTTVPVHRHMTEPRSCLATTPGASFDWLSEDLRRLMVNAMLSLTGHEKVIPDKTNVSFVDDNNP